MDAVDTAIEKLIIAADNHGEDSGELEHTVGDLQELLRRAWGIMSVSQKLQFLRKSGMKDLIETGARGAFSAKSLADDISRSIDEMDAAITAAGYTINEGEGGWYYWSTDEDAGEDFYDRVEAIVNAYAHYAEQVGMPMENSGGSSAGFDPHGQR